MDAQTQDPFSIFLTSSKLRFVKLGHDKAITFFYALFEPILTLLFLHDTSGREYRVLFSSAAIFAIF